MTEIPNPHDRFFKEVLSSEEVVRDFLLQYLPGRIVELMDLNSLESVRGSFVDKELREYFSDLLYKVRLKEGSAAYVYLLFEHKSYPEQGISFYLLRYMVKIWEEVFRGGTQDVLPIIIPLVIYHGRVQWKGPLEFKELFRSPEALTEFLPNYRYLLYDLTTWSDEEIKGIVVLRVTLLLFKYIFRQDFRERLPSILGLLRELGTKRTALEYVETVLRYLIHGTDQISEEDLRRAVEEALPKIGGKVMPTIAEKWIQQGIQQGIREGILEAIELGLKLKFGVEGLKLFPQISKIEDVSRLRMIKGTIEVAREPDEIQNLLESR